MKKYQINKPVTLHDGIVQLTEEQALHRMHKLEPVKGKKDLYKITGPNQFKAGEEIGYDGELPKVIANDMEEVGKSKSQPATAVNPQNVIDILGVLDELDPDSDFTQGNKPKTEALEALLDRTINAVDRDAAWEEYQKGKSQAES